MIDPNAVPPPAGKCALQCPAQPLEPHHETLGVELEVALQDLLDFRIAERAAVAVHQLEPQIADRGGGLPAAGSGFLRVRCAPIRASSRTCGLSSSPRHGTPVTRLKCMRYMDSGPVRPASGRWRR